MASAIWYDPQTGLKLPINYFVEKPRFAPGLVPYEGREMQIVDEVTLAPIPGAQRRGRVAVLPPSYDDVPADPRSEDDAAP